MVDFWKHHISRIRRLEVRYSHLIYYRHHLSIYAGTPYDKGIFSTYFLQSFFNGVMPDNPLAPDGERVRVRGMREHDILPARSSWPIDSNVLRPMITGWSMVSFLNICISSGIFHGIAPLSPMTLLVDTAATMVSITPSSFSVQRVFVEFFPLGLFVQNRTLPYSRAYVL